MKLLIKYQPLFIFLATIIVVSGCDIWSDKPGVPHEILIKSFSLVTGEGEGTNSNNISEVWVYSETDVMGVFPLPASIPLISENNDPLVSITILPGIRVNGISATRKPYPFYQAMELDVFFEPGRIDSIHFESNYTDNSVIILAENFESANRFESSSTSTAEVVRTIDPLWVYEGVASGLILLSEEAAHITSTTQEQLYNLPSTGVIYLEFNYKCDNSFAVGLEVIGGNNAQRTPIIVLNPTGDEWKKMYLDLGPLVLSTPGAFGYELTLDAILDIGEETGYVVVDNFKIVHY
ncbi:MAG: hypothetical protein COA49_02130 [Bacteroidetes bacterium]|nr:MAG: hypothetical protein COA49_02130 [Bacteroidota bacterium]